MAKKAKGKATRGTKSAGSARSRLVPRRSVKRPSKKAQLKGARRPTAAKHLATRASSKRRKRVPSAKPGAARTAQGKLADGKLAERTKSLLVRRAAPRKMAKARPPGEPGHPSPQARTPRLDRVRRTLDETVPTPPSSLNMDRHGSAARTGRAGIAETLEDHRGMSPAITAGDVDVDVEDAYFTGDEAPGGDNPTPDQDIVDDIGKALGVQYEDNEELKASDKIVERDRHRWEMDPASSEDYKDRK
jgi:hypothetical protein